MARKQTTIGIVVDPETKAQIEAAAERENRTVSNWVLTVIKGRLAEEARADDLVQGAIQTLRDWMKMHAEEFGDVTDVQRSVSLDADTIRSRILDTPKDDG